MEEREENEVRRRLSDDAAENGHTKLPPDQEERQYAGIRGHEGYILFHFFTMFGVCFFIGVVIIHLSLCMNSNTAPASIFSLGVNEKDASLDQQNTKLYLEEKPLWHAFENPFILAPNYRPNATVNVTSKTVENL
uniref:Uncharacterized protein n=1 Tax=Ciona savignyi TaxID=51511 RepID=H2ZKR9_CIOSA